MSGDICRGSLLLVGTLLLASCSGPAPRGAPTAAQPASPAKEAEIRAALAQLDPADRKLAEAQRYCAVQGANRLGSMDVPYKLLVQGEPVFLCCEHCKQRALADPQQTLKKVAALRAKPPPGPAP